MADNYNLEIIEWMDRFGVYLEGAPTPWAREHDARRIVAHLTDDYGTDVTFTAFSDQGWTEESWDAQVDDSVNFYQ